MTQHPVVRFALDFNDRQIDLMQKASLSRFVSQRWPHRAPSDADPPRASPAYFARHGSPYAAADVVDHAASPIAACAPITIRTGARARSGCRCVSPRAAVNSCSAPVAGEAWACSPIYVRHAVRAGQRVRLLDEHAWPELSAYAIYPPKRHLSRRVRAFIDSVAERLAGEPCWDR
jgi:DNA-binding transcriptional LysR family regulator